MSGAYLAFEWRWQELRENRERELGRAKSDEERQKIQKRYLKRLKRALDLRDVCYTIKKF